MSAGEVLDVFSQNQEPVVTILFKNCHQYRVDFFDLLAQNLSDKGIQLRLVVGNGLPEDEAKGDRATLPWAETRNFRSINVAGHTMLWQPGFDLMRESDLIITEQATKQLFNLVISYGQRLGRTKHAFWGHGRNFQASIEGSAGEGLKKAMTQRAHWFFSYNDLSTEAACEFGMDRNRVTPVMNSTDTTRVRHLWRTLPTDAGQRVRAKLGMGDGPVALYLGGIYSHKRPEFVVKAAEELRDLIPTFEMLVIGDGSSAHLMERASKRHSWFHHLGSHYGDDKVALANVASVQLMPGLVGLNIVDAFAMGIPTVTTGIDYHSPEIEYLVNGENGLILPEDATPREYAESTAALLNDEHRLAKMSMAAESSGRQLSVEDMAERFADGVVQALNV